MRNFTTIQYEFSLKELIPSSIGTLYVGPPNNPSIAVLYFNKDIPITFIPIFVDFLEAIQGWIEKYPELNSMITIEQPIERGIDFIARPYHIYVTSLDAYVDWEYVPEAPEELGQMRACFLDLIGRSTDPKDILIENVLKKSLLEPSERTYFNENTKKFIVVEPQLQCEDVKQWANLTINSSL